MEPGGDGGVATKPPAPANPTQRTPADSQSASPTYPDWASAMQVFYAGGPAAPGTTPPVFYPSPPSLPAFVWGTQPLTFGTPVPHGSMFPHGGLGAHPAAPTGETVANGEKEVKLSQGIDSGLTKPSDRGLDNCGVVAGNSGDGEKGTSGSDTCNESGGEESSKTSREDDLSASGKGGYDQILPVSLASSFPAASSHDGAHQWSSFCAGIGNMEKQGVLLTPPATAMNGQGKPVPEEFKGMQDEHEEKRQKRKQSNRESARRSRERRQKECEVLARQVAELNTHNADLRSEIDQLHAECKRIGTENASITEELKALYGPTVLAALGD